MKKIKLNKSGDNDKIYYYIIKSHACIILQTNGDKQILKKMAI